MYSLYGGFWKWGVSFLGGLCEVILFYLGYKRGTPVVGYIYIHMLPYIYIYMYFEQLGLPKFKGNGEGSHAPSPPQPETVNPSAFKP